MSGDPINSPDAALRSLDDPSLSPPLPDHPAAGSPHQAFVFQHRFECGASIAETTFASGFENLSHFNRIFLRQTGETPGMFRRRIAEFPGKSSPVPQAVDGRDPDQTPIRIQRMPESPSAAYQNASSTSCGERETMVG